MIILIVFLSLIILIVFHELGHFILAKKFGVEVEEFGIGYPPRLCGKIFKGTLYSLNLLPFGAFVKIKGEEGGIEDVRSFSTKPIWQRALIILGGVASFWLIAAVLLSIVFGLGVPQSISDDIEANNPKVQIIAVVSDSPAEKAGIKIGDTIKEFSIFNSKFSIDKIGQVQELTEIYKNEEIILTIERGKKIFNTTLVPRISPPEGEGAMGVALTRTTLVRYPWYLAPVKGVEACFNLTGSIIAGLSQVLGNLIYGKGLPAGAQLMGPIGIGLLMTQVARFGATYYLQFVALIAIYLAVFNILPIPALDGGKLLFLAIEKVRGRALNPKIEQNITVVFFVLLISIMILVTIKDIIRIF